MSTSFRLLLTRRAWVHAWRQRDALQRECTVCGQREQRDPDGDLMCNGPGAWYVVQAGKRTAHFRQAQPGCADEPAVGSACTPDVAPDVPVAT